MVQLNQQHPNHNIQEQEQQQQQQHPMMMEYPEKRPQQQQRCDDTALYLSSSSTRRVFVWISSSLFSVLTFPTKSVTAMDVIVINDEIRISPASNEFVLSTQLGLDRIGSNSINPVLRHISSNPFQSLLHKSINAEPLYFPTFLFGAWNVTANLLRSTQIAKDSNMISMDTAYSSSADSNANAATTTLQFQRQYFTTIANTIQNQITMNLGTGIPETKIIANRAYNLPSELILVKNMISHAGLFTDNITNLLWDYRSSVAPTRMTWENIVQNPPSILYSELEAIDYESEYGGANHQNVFAASEHNRLRVYDNNNKDVSKTIIEIDTTTEYHKLSDGIVQALARSIISDSNSPKSVMVLDYDFIMNRVVQSFTNHNDNTALTNRPCVETPRGIIQCY